MRNYERVLKILDLCEEIVTLKRLKTQLWIYCLILKNV